MKKFLIKVDGVAYDVEVEETGAVQGEAVAAPAAKPAPVKPAPAKPAAKQQAAAPKSAAAPAGSENVEAPMPGTIMSVNVDAGDEVKQGQVLCVLEAMKMENEIVSPRDGVVASVNTSKGASVKAGDPLISLE